MSSNSDCGDLVLGTVQLGMPYGLANITGRPDQTTATEMVAVARQAGVRYFDTAQAYGESEKVLGTALVGKRLAAGVCIVSKTQPGIDFTDSGAVLFSLRRSLVNLGREQIWGFLLHREEDMDQWHGPVGQSMRETRHAGLTQRLGVSVYSAERALQALNVDDIEIIQVAANMFDRRMARAGFFTEAHARGKMVFIRSIYLQGLVLAPHAACARAIPHAAEAGAALQGFCRRYGVTPQKLALSYVRNLAPGAKFIIGAETVRQVQENCAWFAEPPLSIELCDAWNEFWPQDYAEMIDPRFWPSISK